MNKKALWFSAFLALIAVGVVFADGNLVLEGVLFKTDGSVDATRVARYLKVYRGDPYPDEDALASVVADTEKCLAENVPEYDPSVSYYIKGQKGGKPAAAFIVITLKACTILEELLPTEPSGHALSAGTSDTPTLAEKISPVLGIRPLLDGAVLALEGTVPFLSKAVYGGYDDGEIYGGLRVVGGVSVLDSDGVGFFARGNVFAEYDRVDGSGSKNIAWSTTFGFFGQGALPWAFTSSLVCEHDNGYEPYGSSVLGTVFPLADLGALGFLKGTGDVGLNYGVALSSDEYPDFFLRASLALDGRSFLGPLAQGVAARLALEGGVDSSSAEPYGTGSFIVEGSYRLKSVAGVSGLLGVFASTSECDSWTDHLRILTSGSVTGSLGIVASLELPVLFARGVLFHSQKLAVDFFFQPFLDAALVRPDSSSVLFCADNLYASTGGELSMTLDRYRKCVLRLTAGADMSGLLQGDSGYSMDLVASAVLSVQW